MCRRVRGPESGEEGFTLIQMLTVLLLTATVLGMGLGGFNQAIDTVRGDANMNILQWQFKLARETAINQRRSVEVRFTLPNFISVVRRDLPNGTTTISTAVLESRTQFYVFPGMPDTPDSFGHAASLNFSGAANVMFNSDGQFTDGVGNIINGSVFIGRPGATMTARALTVFGPMSLIRTYRWNGSAWKH